MVVASVVEEKLGGEPEEVERVLFNDLELANHSVLHKLCVRLTSSSVQEGEGEGEGLECDTECELPYIE